MNKKQALKLRHKRQKHLNRLKRFNEAEQMRRREFREFRLDYAPDYAIKRFALEAEAQCELCSQQIDEDDLRTGKFMLLQTKPKQNLYAFHHSHFFEDDLQTPLPEAEVNLRTARAKILEREFPPLQALQD